MPRPGTGNPGNKGGGRPGYGIELKITRFKNIAWDFIIKECEEKPEEIKEYIKLFASRLMPQEIKGSGENGEIEIKIAKEISDKYATTPKSSNNS